MGFLHLRGLANLVITLGPGGVFVLIILTQCGKCWQVEIEDGYKHIGEKEPD